MHCLIVWKTHDGSSETRQRGRANKRTRAFFSFLRSQTFVWHVKLNIFVRVARRFVGVYVIQYCTEKYSKKTVKNLMEFFN